MDAKNSKGDVEVTLPPNASASVSARTRNGDIVSDYNLPSNEDEGDNKAASFQVGGGGARIVLSAENGDVRVKKGATAFPPTPPTAPATPTLNVPPYPKTPDLTKTPHLKTSKPTPPQAVTQ